MHTVDMTGFVYRWRNTETDMLYIGSHGGTPDDGYIGSGVRFREAYDAAPHLFVREILYTGPEYRVVEDEWLIAYDAGRNPQFYNRGSRVNGAAQATPEARAKMSATRRNSPKAAAAAKARRGVPLSTETRAKLAEAHRGVPLSAEHRARVSQARRRSPAAAAAAEAQRGVPRSAETRAKIAEALRGVPLSAEHRAKIAETHRQSPKSAEHRAKLADAWRGVPRSAETRAKIAEALRNAPRITCPHCGKSGAVSGMKRYHFDNCEFPEVLDDVPTD